MPELRIADEALWARVKARQADSTGTADRTSRRKTCRPSGSAALYTKS